ncbi:MAG: dTDP-4-dehydrorhamnose reductase [Acidobacteria bacterium]|nr:dTDP-4-dehydrorhamnose reductase [Acidobacteriota bacterium]
MERRRFLITGAGGLLGRHAVGWFSRYHDVVAARREDLGITHPDAVNRWVNRISPDVIMNCAALSNVDACERQPDDAFAVNAEGPRYLAQAAEQIGAQLIHFSTDYVFDGDKTTPYTIEDEPWPISIYGHSKLAGERAIRETLARHYIIRVARLFGRGGRNFASAILDIARRDGRLLAIVDEIGSPTYVVDLAERVNAIVQSGQHGTYHLTNQGVCSWAEFATAALQIGQLHGVIIEQVQSADLGRPARRPRYTAMRCLLSERLGLEPLRPWTAAFAEFVHQQEKLRIED